MAATGLLDVQLNKSDQAKFDRMMTTLMDGLSAQGMDKVLRVDVHPIMRARISDRFEQEGDTTVGTWADITDVTKDIRADLGFPEGPINHRTGQLRRWVETSYQMNRTGANVVEMAMPGPFTNPTLEKKFRKAQQGKAPGSKIVTVPRPVLAIGQAENDMVTDRLKYHIDRVLRSA